MNDIQISSDIGFTTESLNGKKNLVFKSSQTINKIQMFYGY